MAKKNKKNTDKSLLGRNSIFTPDVINYIHIKSQLGRYRMRGMALMKKIPHWDDLTFLPGTLDFRNSTRIFVCVSYPNPL